MESRILHTHLPAPQLRSKVLPVVTVYDDDNPLPAEHPTAHVPLLSYIPETHDTLADTMLNLQSVLLEHVTDLVIC